MKKIIYAFTALLLMTACAKEYPNNIHEEGIGPILIGMNIKSVPAKVEGLYDTIVIKHTEAYFDDFEGETIPAYDTYLFKAGKETAFKTVPTNDGEIEYLEALSPSLDFRGLSPEMSCRSALLSEAKLLAYGSYESCYFYSCFRFADVPNIDIVFPIAGGNTFSRKGANKLCNLPMQEDGGPIELNFATEDFRKSAKISHILIGGK
jgi:hypothetical protein